MLCAAAIQTSIPLHSTLSHFQALISQAAEQGATLICLPELHNHPYFPITENNDHFALAETIPGPSTDHFSQLARQHQVVLVISLFEKRTAGIYHNTAVVIEKTGEIAGMYRKMHIPDDPGFYEKFYFTPGDLGFEPIQTSVGKLGVLICWDQWFPEAARLMALKGAEVLIYPTAIGWDPAADKQTQTQELQAWTTIQRSHAIANGLPVISINRTGLEADPSQQTQGIAFWGNSFICGPQGEVITQAQAQATTLITDIHFEQTETMRQTWPFLRDRRLDAYPQLLERFVDNN